MLALRLATIALSIALLAFGANAADPVQREGVLIIHSNQRPTPAAVLIEDTMRQVLDATAGRPVEIYSEYLDVERFTGAGYAATQGAYLATKYGDRNIRVIVAAAPPALQFATEVRERFANMVPVVHLALPKDQLELTSFRPAIVGATVDLDPTATIELAMRLQPDVKHLVVVLGAAERDRIWGERVRGAVGRLRTKVEVRYLAGLRTEELLRELRALPKDTVVYTPGYFVDGAGQVVTPRRSVELIASASSAPVYGPLDTFLGAGIVGGYMAPYADQATRAGAIVVSLLNGTRPSEIAASSVPNKPLVDWRQIRRWGIDDHLLPADTIVRFREPTTWDKYSGEVSVAIFVLFFQAGMITWLLIERRRRLAAEADSRKRFAEMTHMNRRVAMGGLAASIAHELNQPLGAIHNNASTAQILIKGDPPRLDEVAEILEDIKHDDKRASEVLARIRRMLRKSDIEVAALDLNEAIGETLKLLAFDVRTHGVSVQTEVEPGLPKVRADRVQVQQVILNLALNAMEAMHDQPEERRQLTIRAKRAGAQEAEVSVVDSGAGIPAEILRHIFDPFVSSKSSGMGLGLSISRTIVEAYGGRIRAENPPSGGAALHFTLPFASERSS